MRNSKRTFKYQFVHIPARSIYAFKPMWSNNLDAMYSFGVMHDLMEHYHTDIPTLAQEVMAHGAMIYTRWQSGMWKELTKSIWNNQTFEQNLGYHDGGLTSYFKKFVEEFGNNNFKLKSKYLLTPKINKLINKILKLLERKIKENLCNFEGQNLQVNSYINFCRFYMTIGYVKCRKRYNPYGYYNEKYNLCQIKDTGIKLINQLNSIYKNVYYNRNRIIKIQMFDKNLTKINFLKSDITWKDRIYIQIA